MSTLDKMHLTNALESALHKQKNMPERPHAFLELRYMWDTMTTEQRQKKRDEYAAKRLRLDDSHPPTADRITVVRAHPQRPVITLNDSQSAIIDQELTPFVKVAEQRAYDEYQDRYSY